METSSSYPVKRFELSRLNGISDRTLETHFKLYEGYVKNSNLLMEEIQGLSRDGKVDAKSMPMLSELKRRLGWEFNGMVLHELYFANLKSGGADSKPAAGSRFARAAGESFEGVERWKADFARVGGMRGVGWAICALDPRTGRLLDFWIESHHVGHVAGFRPIVVMDVWEHAFLLDYAPSERGKYIESFFSNLNWQEIEDRLTQASQGPGRAA